MRMRELLGLQLISCGAELDGIDVARRRLKNVQEFFEADGLPDIGSYVCSAPWDRPKWISNRERTARYVICRLHMNADVELCGFLCGDSKSSASTKTRQQAAWLKRNFELTTQPVVLS